MSTQDPFDNLLPQEAVRYPRGPYDPFPSFALAEGQIHEGFDTMARAVKDACASGLRVLAIDGYHGVNWPGLMDGLGSSLARLGVNVRWRLMSETLLSAEALHAHVAPFLGGKDRVFGVQYPLGLETFFDPVSVHGYRIEASRIRGQVAGGEVVVFLGCGARLVEQYDQLWYVDIPKDDIQERGRRGELGAIGDLGRHAFEQFYKRSYFVDWPALNRHKRDLLPLVDVFVDGQPDRAPTWMTGEDFRAALGEVAGAPFRVRPWFMPGPWGGKYMQQHMGLDPSQPNFAWSYELIAPENGIVLESGRMTLECSFDCLMYLEHRRVLGEAAGQFKYEWPIRLDYLDTVDGGNLSTQCHPRPDYIRRQFGETFTQDETYYISVAKPDARVYIGLTEGCDPKEFEEAVAGSEAMGEAVDIERYVHVEPSKPGDLFLIPNGTVHCSGRGNLVLEISATPYIFTFKIYDYLRKDLNGVYRPLNVRRAFDNIRFERRAGWIRENFLARPRFLREGQGWKEFVLADRPETFYNIHRIEFDHGFSYQTDGRAFAINLVEGERIEVTSARGRTSRLAFLESMVVPAATGAFTVRNLGRRPGKIVLVYVRPGIGVNRPLNLPQE